MSNGLAVVDGVRKGVRNITKVVGEGLLGNVVVLLVFCMDGAMYGRMDGFWSHNMTRDKTDKAGNRGRRLPETGRHIMWVPFTTKSAGTKRGQKAFPPEASLVACLYMAWCEKTLDIRLQSRPMGTLIQEHVVSYFGLNKKKKGSEGLKALRDLIIGSGLLMFKSRRWQGQKGSKVDGNQQFLNEVTTGKTKCDNILKCEELVDLFDSIHEAVYKGNEDEFTFTGYNTEAVQQTDTELEDL